jgi:hypothetical protein
MRIEKISDTSFKLITETEEIFVDMVQLDFWAKSSVDVGTAHSRLANWNILQACFIFREDRPSAPGLVYKTILKLKEQGFKF